MKKGDILWPLGLSAIIAILIVPATHAVFVNFTTAHAYLAGFVKFFMTINDGRTFSYKDSVKQLG